MISEGKYLAKVKKAVLSESSKGTEQVVIDFELVDPELQGQTIAFYGSFSEAAAPYTIEKLRTCGFKGDDILQLDSIVGNEVELVIAHEEYEGKVRAKVKFINALGGTAMAKPLQADKARAFSARMKGLLATTATRAPTKAPPKPAENVPDDLPF